MGRIYTIPMKKVTISAAQDVWSVKAGAGKPFRVLKATFGQSTKEGDANAGGLDITISKAGGSYTVGSGGTTPTPVPVQTSDTAFGGTTHMNDTTAIVAGSGSLTLQDAFAFNEQGGYYELPVPEQVYWYMPAEACVVNLPTAPVASIVASGTLTIEEFG